MSETPPAKQFFRSSKGIVVPRAGRRVHTPLSNCGIRAISDLMPTICVTETYPVVNNPTITPPDAGTRYDQAIVGTQSDNNSFDAYRLCLMKDEGLREGGWFTRLFFAPDISPVFPDPLAVPAKTEWKYKDMLWHPILEQLQFTPDYTTMVSVQGKGGIVTQSPRLRVNYAYRPAFECSTKIREQYFVSSSPFDLSKFSLPDIPQPHDVSWDIEPIGASGSISRCLHPKKIEVPAVTRSKGLVNGSVDQIFPTTNATSWIDYDFELEIVEIEPFQIAILRRAYAPNLTPLTKISTY